MKPVKAWAIKTKRGSLARWYPSSGKLNEVIIKHRAKDLEAQLEDGEIVVRVEIRELGK